MGRLRTENPQLGAYAMAKGGVLDRVDVTGSDKGANVTFEIDYGGDENLVRDEYYRGLAIVNLAEFFTQLGQLQEHLFTALVRNDHKRRLEQL